MSSPSPNPASSNTIYFGWCEDPGHSDGIPWRGGEYHDAASAGAEVDNHNHVDYPGHLGAVNTIG